MAEFAHSTATSPDRWPMTLAARESLVAEASRLVDDVAQGQAAGLVDEEGLIRLPVAHAARKLDAIRAVLEASEIVADKDTVVIGRRVTVCDADGQVSTYALVVPGDGDPFLGWISAGSPLGAAILGRRPGDHVEVAAPGGRWTVAIIAVE